MPSNRVGGVSVTVKLDDKDALNQLNKLRQKIQETEKSLAQKTAKRDSIAEEMNKAEISAERARQKVEKLKSALESAPSYEKKGIREKLSAANADLKEQTKNMDTLNRQWQKLDGEITEANASLESMKVSQTGLETQVRASQSAVAKLQTAVARATNKMTRSFRRVGRMITKVFWFSVILRGLRAIREYMSDLLLSFPQIRDVLSEIKGNLLTAFTPIFNALLPHLMTLLTVLRDISAVIADVIARLFGTTAENAQQSAEALQEQSDAYKAVGSSAKKASKQLASFDQLNVLSSDSSGSGSSSSATAPKFNQGFDFGGMLEGIELLAGMGLLVIGAVLTFTGANIPVGLAMMALGAASVYAAFSGDSESLKKSLDGTIGDIELLVSEAALVLGAVLAFSGANIPLGIALIAMGALGLAAAVKLNWEAVKTKLRGTIGKITAIVSAAILVLGAVLTFTGANLPLGIALMALGAAGLATVAVVNWDVIKQKLQGTLGVVSAIVSGFLLVLGAVLTFTGASPALGIGLMIAGAAGLAGVAVVNWDSIKKTLGDVFQENKTLILGGLLVLGVIFTAIGMFGFGIPMILGALAGMFSEEPIDWDSVRKKVAEVWESVKTYWNTHIAQIFTKEWWKEKFSSISEGLKEKIKDGVNGAIELVNRFIDWINEKLNFSWDGLKVLGKQVIPAGQFQLFTIPHIPALAQGAVIPPNREFLAMLGDQKSGTNIETPLETMVQAFKQALSESGGGSVNLYLDGQKIASSTMKYINRNSRAGGKLGIV